MLADIVFQPRFMGIKHTVISRIDGGFHGIKLFRVLIFLKYFTEGIGGSIAPVELVIEFEQQLVFGRSREFRRISQTVGSCLDRQHVPGFQHNTDEIVGGKAKEIKPRLLHVNLEFELVVNDLGGIDFLNPIGGQFLKNDLGKATSGQRPLYPGFIGFWRGVAGCGDNDDRQKEEPGYETLFHFLLRFVFAKLTQILE